MELVIGFCRLERSTVVKRLKNRDWNVKETKISVTKYGGWLQISGRFAGLVIVYGESKVKECAIVQALMFCTGLTAHGGSTGRVLIFLDYGTRRGWGVSVKSRPLFSPGKDPVPIVQEAAWAPWPIWTGPENLVPTGFDPRTVQFVASRYTDYVTRPFYGEHMQKTFVPKKQSPNVLAFPT